MSKKIRLVGGKNYVYVPLNMKFVEGKTYTVEDDALAETLLSRMTPTEDRYFEAVEEEKQTIKKPESPKRKGVTVVKKKKATAKKAPARKKAKDAAPGITEEEEHLSEEGSDSEPDDGVAV